jgi:hypothetical protein
MDVLYCPTPTAEGIVLSPVLDSYQFSIIMRVRVLTSIGKTHVSSVRQDFTYETPPRFAQGTSGKYYCILSTITWNICIIYGIHVSTLFDIRRSGGGVVAVIV